MLINSAPLLFLPVLAASQALSALSKPTPRSLDAILLEPREPAPSSSPTRFPKHLDLRQAPAAAVPPVVAPAAGAQQQAAAPATTVPAAGAQQQAAAPATTTPAAGAQQPAAVPAPAAPAAGVGGAGAAPAAAQPAAGAQANAVTTVMVNTVVNGVTQQVASVFTQIQGAGAGGDAPAVQTGSIGMGTLTGKVGALKTRQAKSDAVAAGKGWSRREMLVGVIVGLGILMGGGFLGVGIGG